MRNTRPKALPHPVLSPFSDDVSPNTFAFDCRPENISCDTSRWLIGGEIRHDNSDLAELVKNGAAAYGLHVECPRTFLRKWFPQKTTKITVELSAAEIWGRVEMSAFCIAEKDLSAYCILGQHSDYETSKFQIRAGDILAFAPTVEFDAFLDIDPIRKISSILDIRKSDDRLAGPVLIDFNLDRIQLELSRKDYETYLELRSDPSLRGLLASNVVLPAILQAINYICSLEEGEFDDAKAQLRWCRSLSAKLDNAGVKRDSSPELVFRCAQEILKEPIRRGLDDILLQIPGGGR